MKEKNDLDSLDSYHDDVNVESPAWDITDGDYEIPPGLEGDIIVPNTDDFSKKEENKDDRSTQFFDNIDKGNLYYEAQ